MTDEQRERLIEAWRVILELDPTNGMRRIAADVMRRLIAERSAHQVEQMERERGLRAS